MFCIAAFLPFSYLMNLLARCFHAMYIIIYLMAIACYILQNLDWIFIKIDLTFLDPNWLWQAFYLLKIIPKSSAFSFIGELFSHVILTSLCSSCISVCYGIITISIWPGILRREGWKYFTGKIEHLELLLFLIICLVEKHFQKKCLHKCRSIH